MRMHLNDTQANAYMQCTRMMYVLGYKNEINVVDIIYYSLMIAVTPSIVIKLSLHIYSWQLMHCTSHVYYVVLDGPMSSLAYKLSIWERSLANSI